MNIELHSPNTQFNHTRAPKYIKWVKDAPVKFYSDEEVLNAPPGNYALMIEPYAIFQRPHEYLINNWHWFRTIFTHDSELLRLPNARPIIFGNVWEYSDEPKEKDISMVGGRKNFCELHRKRRELALSLADRIDIYGIDEYFETREAHAPYRFEVVVENYVDYLYFSEKICNCFAAKTVPIYYGARLIDMYFNPAGIIRVSDLKEVPKIVDQILKDPSVEYNKRLPAILENYLRVKNYECFEDWFYLKYKHILEEL